MRRLTAFALCLLTALPLGASEPGVYSPNVYRGETFVRVLTWYDSSSALVNLTGYTAALQIRSESSNTLLLSLTDADGLTLGGVAGTITWTMTAARTATLPVGASNYDLRLTSGAGVVTFLIYGKVQVVDSVTE